jgi:hypothetical protein
MTSTGQVLCYLTGLGLHKVGAIQFFELPSIVVVANASHMVYTDVVKHRTNIYLTTDQVKRLKALNEKTGAPVAELVRRAVDAYLKNRAKRK